MGTLLYDSHTQADTDTGCKEVEDKVTDAKKVTILKSPI